MLTGLVLLAVGAALLGYVVTARQPQPVDAPSASRPKSSTPNSPASSSVAPKAEVEDLADTAETQVMRVRSTPLSDAVLEPPPNEIGLASAPVEHLPPRSDPTVVVAYEDEAEEEEATSPLARIWLRRRAIPIADSTAKPTTTACWSCRITAYSPSQMGWAAMPVAALPVRWPWKR